MPSRLARNAGRQSLVDEIPFTLPVAGHHSPALMAAFSIDATAAEHLLPGNELHPLRISPDRGVLLITVINYQLTNIGKYIEFSVGIGCTHGLRASPPLLPLLLRGHYDMGQYVFDLPVSTDISVKGGKGIWGMPKHKANLDFKVEDSTVSSQYDLDGQLCLRITIARPRWDWLPLSSESANFCEFRGLLMKSSIYFKGKVGLSVFKRGSANLIIGEHPRVAPLKSLDISPEPLATVFFPSAQGVLDDHFESWFVSYPEPPTTAPEGFESVINLPQDQTWLPPPTASGRLEELAEPGPEQLAPPPQQTAAPPQQTAAP